jgi:2-dehydro-3-deoxyphosphogluconate aldolase / (4S)-4-hydroxy-2-oxoglutarate aldolase
MSLFDQPDNPLIMPVIVINDAERAVPLAEALLAGGLNWIEITLRTPAALECIRRIAKALPEMRVGAGTVITEELAQNAIDAGATFGLAPGFSRKILRVFKMNEVPFIPGVCTPTEITIALEHGYKKLKFFPAEPAGGASYLAAANAPYKSYGVQYCPTGGLNLNNMADYLKLPEVFTIGGSWLATAAQIANSDWNTVTEQTRAALAKAKEVRG